MTVTVPHYPRPAIFSEESSVLPRSAFPGRLGTLRSPRRARKWRWDLLHGPDSLLGCSTNQDGGVPGRVEKWNGRRLPTELTTLTGGLRPCRQLASQGLV